MFVHEFIHWVALRLLGYRSSKLIFRTKGIWIFRGMGIKPIGVRNNVDCARDMFIVILLPLAFSWMYIFPMILFDGGITWVGVLFTCVLALGGSSSDIKSALKIRKWWLKPHRLLPTIKE